VHQTSAGEASTFWAGLGALRASVFRSVGGFDERFRRPSVEDIELGYRLTERGYRILLAPEVRGRHLKRWTLRSSLATDVLSRGIPWTQLLYRRTGRSRELNVSLPLRLSVLVSYVCAIALGTSLVIPHAGWVAGVALLILISLNRAFYVWLATQRGWWFAVRAVAAHALHHLANGVSYIVGSGLSVATRLGWRLPGAVAAQPWTPHTSENSSRPTPDRV
jgi:GT2 family glycosyltransferase